MNFTRFSFPNLQCLCNNCLFIKHIKLRVFGKVLLFFVSLIAVFKNLLIIGDFPYVAMARIQRQPLQNGRHQRASLVITRWWNWWNHYPLSHYK